MSNPFTDTWLFLIGQTPDHEALGLWKYLFVALFLALLAASIAIAVQNWREDPSQRTGTHLATWVMRVLIGCMWFQGMLWKLPLDRKSTRLNSSHANISYAVFCLKKKNLPSCFC